MQIKTQLLNKDTGWFFKENDKLDSPNTVVFVFGSPSVMANQDIMKPFAQQFKHAHIVGCSTAGEIFQDTVNDESLSCAIAQFEKTHIHCASATVSEFKSNQDIGEHLGQKLLKNDLQGIMIFSDGTLVNGSELVNGINNVVPKEVTVSGGLAGDGDKFQNTHVFKDGMPQSGMVTAIGFYGDAIHLSSGSKGGWDIFGPERIITKSKGNILYEIDGQPALKLYKEYLGERAKELPASALLFPLSIREDEDSTKQVVRTILNINEEDQSMIFAGDVPQGWCAQLMKATFDRLIEGAQSAGKEAYINNNDNTLAIAISCVGRRLVLGERIDEEVEATLESLPKGTKQIGFYSYGEISPNGIEPCALHNQTMTITTIWEDMK